MNEVKRVNLTKAAAIFFIVCVGLSFVVFLSLMFMPIDVLKDWSYKIKEGEYRAGTTIVVTTRFEKVRAVSGTAKRYIVCEAPGGSTVRLPISESNADRPAEQNVSDIYLRIPDDIPTLPANCFIETNIEYNIYSFRKHYEHNRTQSFRVLPPENQPQDTSPITQSPDSDNEVVENAPNNARKQPSPDFETVPSTQTRRDNQQPEQSEPSTKPVPGPVGSLLQIVTQPVRDVVNALGGLF